jgi:hypothetical protein
MKAVLIAAALLAQTSGAPVDLSGTWTLDTNLSDNPEQVAAAIRADLHLGCETATFVMRNDRGRSRGRPEPRDTAPKEPNADEQKRIDDLTTALRYPPPTLRIAQTGTTLTLTDAQGQTHTLSHWEGPQLVSTTDLGGGRRMTSTYSLLPMTRQLIIRTQIERAPNQPGPFEIKQVYDRGGETR